MAQQTPQIIDRKALNSVRHGLRSQTLAVPGLEEHKDWLTFRDGVIESLSPEGQLESELSICIAECLWRRRRVARHELELIDIERRREDAHEGWKEHVDRALAEGSDAEPARDFNQKVRDIARHPYAGMLAAQQIDAMIRPAVILPAGKQLDRIMRYEAHLSRQVYHALHELQALQAHRRGEPAPLARVSVLGGA